MKLAKYLRWSFYGWLAGVVCLSMISYVILPAVIGSRPQQNPGSQALFTLALVLISPFAMVGGIFGGKMQQEGGSSSQWPLAALAGACATIPLACVGLWMSGW
jgi:uncharacterized membrane protein